MENELSNYQSRPARPPMPDSHMALAIAATAFTTMTVCCLPVGIYAIALANKVDKLYFAGMYAEAEETSNRVKTWSIAGIILSVVTWVIYVILCIVGGVMSEM